VVRESMLSPLKCATTDLLTTSRRTTRVDELAL
jgi:hypothetical protein